MSESQHKFMRRNIQLREELGHKVPAFLIAQLIAVDKGTRRQMWLMLLRQKADFKAAANGTLTDVPG